MLCGVSCCRGRADVPSNHVSANELAHREGRPHLRRLWGMILCRLCETTVA